MPHIHTDPGQIDAVSTGYVVLKDGDEYKILLHQHKKLKMLLACGGHIELNETPWSAMAHELKEEAGYELDELYIMQPEDRISSLEQVVVHPQPLLVNTHKIPGVVEHYHTETSYLFMAKNKPTALPQDGESQDLHWYTRQQVVDLPQDKIWSNTRVTILAIFDTFLPLWKPVPVDEFSLSKRADEDLV